MTAEAERLARNRATWDAYDALFSAMRFEEWADLWTEDGRFVFRNPAPGGPEVLEGRAAIHANYAPFRESLDAVWFADRTFEPTEDPDVAWARYTVHADIPDGSRFRMPVAARLRFHDGRLAELQLYGHARVDPPEGTAAGG